SSRDNTPERTATALSVERNTESAPKPLDLLPKRPVSPVHHLHGNRFRRYTLKQLRTEVCPGITRMDIVADAVVTKAETGDLRAVEFLRDTVDGPLESQFGNIAVGLNVQVSHATVETE